MEPTANPRWPNVALFIGAIVAALALALLCGTAAGCASDRDAARSQARRDVATVLRIAYEVGGKTAVADRIDALVAKGKLTPEQGKALKAFANEACEEMLNRLDGGGVGATDCSDCFDAVTNAVECTGGNEDANCGNCDACKADCGEKGTGGNAPVAVGDQVGRTNEASEPRSGRKSPRDAATGDCSGCETR